MDFISGLVDLCKEYGTADYVLGGGGNASVKDGDCLWIKPSGIALSAVSQDTLVAVDRLKLRNIFTAAVPHEPDKRESAAKELLLSSMLPGFEQFRPSVETPLHEAFTVRYVVHTHPALVNGLTCSQNGAQECKKMFPDALWMSYVDPGYTLSMAAYHALAEYQQKHGKQPEIVIKQNHGIFIAADSTERIIALYDSVMETLRNRYRDFGISLYAIVGEAPSSNICNRIIECLDAVGQNEPICIAASGWSALAPLSPTPDHIVYTKRHYLHSNIDVRPVVEFTKSYGHLPRVWATDQGVFGIGTSESSAQTALAFALDGALLAQLTACFGGAHYMTEEQGRFIDTWEVENYRRKVADSGQTKPSSGVLSRIVNGSTPMRIERAYRLAREQFAENGIDCERALGALKKIPLSINCWQGDDVRGFEHSFGGAAGIIATGAAPGAARTPDELQNDLQTALALIPGTHRVNLHAIYADTNGKKVDRNELAPEHFASWVAWARNQGIGLDFNPTFFNHPLAAQGATLTSANPSIRKFWVDHAIACRQIGEHFGKTQGTASVTNVWIPDGSKEMPADRFGPRERLMQSLDGIFAVQHDSACLIDAVESKLFGIGLESYTAGSHEFYLAYALRNHLMVCLDMGHFHPTESIADKLSAMLLFMDRLLIHVSRPMRWDSDHVVTLTDELRDTARELVWNGWLDRVFLALDYFDASINRIAAWVIGARATLKAILIAMLEPKDAIRKAESNADPTGRLALLDDSRILPYGAVWDYYCLQEYQPIRSEWLVTVHAYEEKVTNKRV